MNTRAIIDLAISEKWVRGGKGGLVEGLMEWKYRGRMLWRAIHDTDLILVGT